MNLFRSEEHLKRWLAYSQAAGDYVMTVDEWATVFSASIFRRRLDPDYLAKSSRYLADYRQALKTMGKALPAPDRLLSAVMFTDIVDSTKQAASVGDTEWRARLERHNEVVRSRLGHFGGREVKQTGDGFLSVFDSATDAIQSAIAICREMPAIGLQVRAGIHLGECEAFGDDVGGIAVHIGARIAAIAAPNEVLVSRTVKDAVTGSGIDFEPRGSHELKGVPDHWEVYAAGS